MKKLMLVAAASLSLLAGNALAGSGCIYGSKAEIAALPEQTPAEAEVTDPKLLALLKKQREAAEKEIQVPIIYN